MKVVVIGLGQCGGRIADEFAKMNKKAQTHRGMEIAPGVFAVNTDAADLSGPTAINRDYHHRILIGGRRTGGHGVGKINELGAEVAREDADKVVDAIRQTKHFYETDAFLLIAGAAGGTGSGAVAVIAQQLKERYSDKPVYAILVLPFIHEVETEERAVYNTATCLKSTYSVADAVILVDNQRYIGKDASLRRNLAGINELIASPFYNLLCAGEEKKSKYIGAKVLDAGDIMQTIVGWTVIGYGESRVPLIRLPLERNRNFRKKSTETQKGIQAMDAAISELSLRCNPADARRALFLVSAPTQEMNMDVVKEVGDYLRSLTPQAIIRNGDYPRPRGVLDVTVILSELSNVTKVREYYIKSTSLIPEFKKREQETAVQLKAIEEASKNIPSLV